MALPTARAVSCVRVADWAQALEQVKNLSEPITAKKLRTLGQSHGIGQKTVDKMFEIYRTGKLERYEGVMNDKKYKGLEELTAVWGIGAKMASEYVDAGIMSRAPHTETPPPSSNPQTAPPGHAAARPRAVEL